MCTNEAPTQSRKGKETDWMNQRKQRFYPLRNSGRLSTTGFLADFRDRFKPNCSPISGNMTTLEASPEQRMAEKNGGAIVCKGSALMKRQRNL